MIKKSNKNYVVLEGSVFWTAEYQKGYVKEMWIDTLSWSSDSTDRKDDPRCSEYYLINYLTTDENLFNWHCPHIEVTRFELAANNWNYIIRKGVKVEHSVKQVKWTIEWIEGVMRMAYYFNTSHTDEGIKKWRVIPFAVCISFPLAHFLKFTFWVKAICPFYYTQQEKFLLRTWIKPKTTSDHLFKILWLSSSSGNSEVIMIRLVVVVKTLLLPLKSIIVLL